MKTMKVATAADLEIGKAYHTVRAFNAAGQPMQGIRRSDWRAVLMTAGNIGRYVDGSYYAEPIKDKHTPRLLAAGWTRYSSSRGGCGMAIVTRGPLLGLACEKPAFWAKADVDGGHPMCAQHAVTYI